MMNFAKRISKILLFLMIGLVFISGIASAEYLGPDRVKTEIVSEACDYGVWAHKASDTGETCFDANGNETEGCTDCTWECNPGSPCGIAKYYYVLGNRLVEHSVTVTYPEATVASTTNCAAWGDAGWCVQLSSVTITANEPVAEKVITLIEGTHNGDIFACAADTCTVNMVEGSNILSYWALSSFGDSSRMGNLTVLQDTVAPEINASVTGIMGDNGWFVSNAILSVVFSDAVPGSGLSMTSALFNGVPTDVSSPVTITDGVYDIQLDTRDTAGWTASTAQMVYVDTTAPVITADQPAVEVADSAVTGGGYMNGSVVFIGTYSDPTSGIRIMEVSPDGSHWYAVTLNADGTWTYDWDSSQAKDGSYTPLVYAIDYAGNRTDITMQPITLDNSAPAMSMTGGWYIWDSGHIVVYDNRVGIARIDLSVRDDQNRWPAREWDFDTSKLEMDLQWDRKFGDGTTAPTGSYEVLLQAWDKLGNGRWITSRIYIPEAGATAVIPLDIVSAGTVEDTPTPMVEQIETKESDVEPVVPAAPAAAEPAPTATLQPSCTPSSLNFSSAPIIPASGNSGSTSLPIDPNLLTGSAALAAAAAATAYSLQKKAEMDAEIKRREEQSRAEAMAKVRASEATKVANYLNKLAVDAETEKWTKLITETNGEAITDLSEAELTELISQNAGARNAISNYIDAVKEANKTAQIAADEKAEQAAKRQLHYASQTAAYQASKKTAAINDKLTRVEEQISGRNVITPNQYTTASKTQAKAVVDDGNKSGNWLTNIGNKISNGWASATSFVSNLGKSDKHEDVINPSSPVVPDYMNNLGDPSKNTGQSVFTPDPELQEVIDTNIAKQVEEGVVNKWVANVFNSRSEKLGKLHDSYTGLWKNAITGFQIMNNPNATFWQKVGGGAMGGAVIAAHIIIVAAVIYVTPGGVAVTKTVLTIADAVETVSLIAQAGYQLFTKDPQAYITLAELQFELKDQGLPFNSFGIDLFKYQDEVITYSDDIIDALDRGNPSRDIENVEEIIEDVVDIVDGNNPAKSVDVIEDLIDDIPTKDQFSILGKGDPDFPVSGKSNTLYGSSRNYNLSANDFEVAVTGKPDPDIAIFVDGREFDWYDGDILIDAKNYNDGSWFDFSRKDIEHLTEMRKQEIIKNIKDQVISLQNCNGDFTKIEWRVNSANISEQINDIIEELDYGDYISAVNYSVK